MSFSYTTPLLMQTLNTSATFESVPPYEFGWAATGTVSILLDNWGNVDNTLVVDVYFGTQIKGQLATNAFIVWEKDLALTRTFTATAGTTTDIAGAIDIPKVKGRFMKLGFTLAGTAKTVDIVCYFHGKSDGSSSAVPEPIIYKEAGSVTTAAAKTSAGRVLAFRVTNVNAAVRYFQLHNVASAPSGGATALASFPVPAGTAAVPSVLEIGSGFWGELGKYFDTGISWTWSTTDTTYTAATASDHTTMISRL